MKGAALGAGLALAVAAGLGAQSGELTQAQAARIYIQAGKLATPGLVPTQAISPHEVSDAQGRLRTIATSGATEQERALAAMALGLGEGERGEELQAKADLTLAARWVPARDAATAALVEFEEAASNAAGALEAADAYAVAVTDPFYQQIAEAAAKAGAENGDWPEAVRWTEHLAENPANLWLRAQAEAGTQNARGAALAVRRLEFRYPASAQAAKASAQWRRYEKAMPELRPDWQLEAELARSWSSAGQPRKAAEAWATTARMAPTRERAELECVEARAWLAAGQTGKAQGLAKRLARSTQRAQALEIEVELGRRQHKLAALAGPLGELAAAYPRNGWYARALHEAGDEAILENDDAGVLNAFDTLTARFPNSIYTPEATWRAAWTAYRLGRADAGQRMEAYLRRYPRGGDVADALYWMGRWLRRHGAKREGNLCLSVGAQRFPGTYFGMQARQALPATAPRPATAAEAPGWLRPVLGIRPARAERAPVARAARDLIARAHELQAAGLLDPAATLLEAALRQERPGRGELGLARQVAQLEDERGNWYFGLRAMLRALPDYLEVPAEALPASEWRRLYPIPYPRQIAAASERYGIGRDLLLGVMRQESGFDAKSLSGARARGLMQLELGTAQRVFAHLPTAWQALADPGRLRAADLFNPGLSIALGAADLKRELGIFPTTAAALAAYNAGQARVRMWEAQFPRAHGDVFIETIPFTQTRGYVEAVLRNQAAYRRIYGH